MVQQSPDIDSSTPPRVIPIPLYWGPGLPVTYASVFVPVHGQALVPRPLDGGQPSLLPSPSSRDSPGGASTMNPRATDFTPSTGPEASLPQPASAAPRSSPEDKHAASRPAAPTPVYDFRQQTPSDRAYHAGFTAAQQGIGFFPVVAWSPTYVVPWAQCQGFAEPRGLPGAPLIHPAAGGAHGSSISAGETGGGRAHPVEDGPHIQPDPGAEETSPDGSHETEDRQSSGNDATLSTTDSHHCSDSKGIGSPPPQTEAISPATEQGHPFAAQDRDAQVSARPARGRDSEAPSAQQVPWIPFPFPSDTHDARHDAGQNQVLFHAFRTVGGLVPQSKKERGQSARRALRLGKETLQASPQGTSTQRVGDQASVSQAWSDVGENLESPYGYPSPKPQPQEAFGKSLLSSARTSTASQVPSPASYFFSTGMQTLVQTTPLQSPTQVQIPAPADRGSATSTDASARHHKQATTGVGEDDPSRPKEDPQQARLQDSTSLASSGQDSTQDFAATNFRPLAEPNVARAASEQGAVEEAPSTHDSSAPPGPPRKPRHQEQHAAPSQRLSSAFPHASGSQTTSFEGAARRQTINAHGAPAQPLRPCVPAESGSWSQSKRWMSEGTKERQAFSRLVSNLRHIGADKSPFIPQSLAELAAFKAEVAEANKRELARVVRHRLAELERRKRCLAEGPSALHSAKIGKLFWGKRFNDKLSPVFLSVNCFNEHLSDDHELRVDWPSLAELKEEGDRRGGHYRRYLPLPRLNIVDPRRQGMPREELFNADGTIRWQMKAVSTDPAFIIPVSPPPGPMGHDEESGSRVEDLPAHLQPKPAMVLEL